MSRKPLARRRSLGAAVLIAITGLVAALTAPVAQAGATGAAGSAGGISGIEASALSGAIDELGPGPFSQQSTGQGDVDLRGSVAPTSAQRAAVPAGATVRWNRYGTPASIRSDRGYLSGPSDAAPVAVARAYVTRHRTMFGLSKAQVEDLRLVSDAALSSSRARVVLLRQQFGRLVSAVDGMVTVGIAPRGRVAYASSSLARTSAAPATAVLSPTTAWLTAAADVGLSDLPVAADIDARGVNAKSGWTELRVSGFDGVQHVRLRALALADGSVRPVYETNVVDLRNGAATAYTSFVDAVNGDVLVRHNQVDNEVGDLGTGLTGLAASEYQQQFSGSMTATDCGEDHTFDVDAATKTILVSASAAVATNDIVLKLIYNGALVASSDTGTSPEAVTYPVPAGDSGTYTVRVCPYDRPTVPYTEPGNYGGVFVASESEAPQPPEQANPKWKFFLANPTLDFGDGTTDNRAVGCWTKPSPRGVCSVPPTALNNLAARAPWDYDVRTGTPTNTTSGNAAVTGEAWLSPLTPGGGHQMPISPNREYGLDNPDQGFSDAWNNSRCDPSTLTPGGNDILASVTNLFAGHNRMHDFSYFLGFTEANYNMQDSNFGLTAPGPFPNGREGDPEVGNVQAGAIDGGAPSYLGRDNANQITLQDGIPGITNQYLFQPIAGAFYSPCVDGDFDAPVYGHEYTHAISNRMVGGPDGNLSGFQAGSMGESWSDQVALEYLFEHGYDTGADSPWVEGPYVTGNKVTGIRNYALDRNPLQYGDLGYDVTGPEVHADGEVWSASMFAVRQQLVAKYNAQYPEGDQALQLRCSDGDTDQQPPAPPLPPGQCPGGRRWIQLMFDSFLLQQGATSMLDARDAFLAADQMRFNGRDLPEIWDGFASTGMGKNASTTSTDDDQPRSDYTSPLGPEGALKIEPLDLGNGGRQPVVGTLYAGRYEARVTPIADSDPATTRPATVRLVPGTYDFVLQADGYGLFRFRAKIVAGETHVREIHLSKNVASASNGAFVDGSSASLNASKLIDDTEASNWAGLSEAGVSVDTPGAHPFVNVNLGGGQQVIREVRVSAMLRPADPAQDENPNQPDDESGSRFTALRQFAIEVCNESASNDCSSTLPSSDAASPYQRIYTSPHNAFNGKRPRPLAPNLLMKRFDVPDTAATHVRLVALENQCTGQAGYAGEQDNDPLNATDCKQASTRDESVRAAELEVFGFDAVSRAPGDPVVAMTMHGKPTAAAGERVTYTLTYTNLGPKPSQYADIRVSSLPTALRFVKASGPSSWDPTTRALRWRVGTVPVGATRSVSLTTRVAPKAPVGTAILTTAQFAGAMTYSPPAAAITVVAP